MRLGRAPGTVGESDRPESLGRGGAGVLLGGALERIGESVPRVDDEGGQQLVAARDVPVERGAGHAELLGDRVQRDAFDAVLRELAQGRGLDLLQRPRAQAGAPVGGGVVWWTLLVRRG